jgi:protein TonB
MMRLWLNSYTKSAVGIAVLSSAISVGVHTGVIAAWIYATLPAPGVPENSISDRVYYEPPPDRVPGHRPVGEVVHYVDLSQVGPAIGDGPRTMGEARPVSANEGIGRATDDSVPIAPAASPAETQDSVFTVLDVDTAVVRSANSAAPAYPLKLLEAHVAGYVAARYIVDTTGFADTVSFEVLKSTNPEFVMAVRDALPYMRFRPAKIGTLKVRQLVEQMFTFRINDSTVAEPHKQKPSPSL